MTAEQGGATEQGGADEQIGADEQGGADEQVGADEAGKGPALGPMVAGAVRADPAALPAVADSKQLSAEQRESALAAMEKAGVAWAVSVVPTAVIDDPATDMNGLTVAAQAAAVRAVARPDDRIRADAGDTNADRFGRRLREAVTGGESNAPDPRIRVERHGVNESAGPASVSVQAEHGADDEYRIVAAASIAAKVERDRRMAAIGAGYDRAVGSGYPSDPTTRRFLREYVRETGALPDCARASWATAQDVLEAAEQSGLEEF